MQQQKREITGSIVLILIITLFLLLVMIFSTEEAKLGNRKELLFGKLIRHHKGGTVKPFEKPSTSYNNRVDTTKKIRPTKSFNLFYTFLSPLDLMKYQLIPYLQCRVGHAA